MVDRFFTSALIVTGVLVAGCGGRTTSDGNEDACRGEISFVDPRLEEAVRDAIGRPTGTILDEHVSGLTELDAGFLEVADLSGIECLRGLTQLLLEDNTDYSDGFVDGQSDFGDGHDPNFEITDLSPLSGLARLTLLDVSGQSVSDLRPLAGISSLSRLSVQECLVEDLAPLSELTALTMLLADQNAISDLAPLTGLSTLSDVHLRNNQISDLSPLVANPGLGSGDVVDISPFPNDPRRGPNPIDCAAQASNIQELRDRGVTVEVDCP